jgi:CubicO group peptidase (beta-lactamase class C family)
MKSINDLVQPFIDRQAILAAAVAILKDGEIVELGGFGTASVEESGVKVSPQTLFAYGSISKTICATLVMRLVETGLLDLDTPICDYLPGLNFSNPAYGRKITLRHLLSHTSGLPAAGKDFGPRDPDSLGRFIYDQIPLYTFLAEPGGVHLYSSTVFCIAGYVAEAVTGKYYDDLVQEYVFDPLQMDRTTFDPSVALTYPLALPHEIGPDGKLQVTHRLAYNASGNPSGFALGSVTDLANLETMFLNQGTFQGQRYLSASAIAEMHRLHASRYVEDHAHPLAHANQGYGLGFFTGHYKGRRTARHGGVSQSYNCFFELFPDDRTGVVLLTNYSQEGPLMELVADLYDYALGFTHEGLLFLDKPKAIDPTPDAGQLQHHVGNYLNVESADLATFVLADDALVLERQGKSLPLISIGDGRLFGEVSDKYRLTVAFIANSGGKVTHVMITGEPYFLIEIDPAFQQDSHLWKSYEGIYKDPSNSNLIEIFTVRLQDGVLFVSEGDHEVPAKAISDRCFLSELGLIEFEDTNSNAVKVLVWGKATRYYPLDQHEYMVNGVIRYLVDVQAM